MDGQGKVDLSLSLKGGTYGRSGESGPPPSLKGVTYGRSGQSGPVPPLKDSAIITLLLMSRLSSFCITPRTM